MSKKSLLTDTSKEGIEKFFNAWTECRIKHPPAGPAVSAICPLECSYEMICPKHGRPVCECPLPGRIVSFVPRDPQPEEGRWEQIKLNDYPENR
jgi:hypothetical protein